MAAWIVRGGRPEHEQEALADGVLAIGYDLAEDLSNVGTYEDVKHLLQQIKPDAKPGTVSSEAGRIWNFKDSIKIGDLIVMPRKDGPTIAVGEMAGEYKFRPEVPEMFHARTVAWINREVPRDSLDMDLQRSMNASGTVYQPRADNAEHRLRVATK